MRKFSLLFMVTMLTISVCAQKDKAPALAAFGKIEKADLEMKECDFDPKAEAMVLVEDAQLDFLLSTGSAEMKKRVRIKILNSNGLEWANVHLPYISYRGEESIAGLEAQTYNLDDNGNVVVEKVEKKLIYDKTLSKRYSEKVFTFPGVKVGSIIEYKYKHTNIGLINWYFQASIPVKQSQFTIDFPEEIDARVTPYCSRQYNRTTESSGRREAQTYSMQNVPAFRDEPFIINEDFYRDHLETKIIASEFSGKRENFVVNWVQVIRALMEDEDFGLQIKKNIPRTADLDAKLAGISSSYEKMKVIYRYVQQNMQWNEYVGIWALDGVKSAWKDKKGTAGEINLILINLLKEAGINVHPILVSTHDNGLVNTGDAGTRFYPGYHQFNKVMAYVSIDDKNYVLDATERDTPVHLIPADVLMTEGLVIEKVETFQWGWRYLSNNQNQAKNVILTEGVIDASGKMTGSAIISSYDYARLSRLPTVKKGKDKFIEKYISGVNAGMNIEDVIFENLDTDSLPLVQTVKFNQTLNSSGDYRYFSSNILTGLEINPFVADNRFSDIFFGTNQNSTVIGSYILPEGYELDALPKNIKMIMPDTSIIMSRMSQVSGNVLMTKVQLEFKKSIYPASQYGEFQEFYKQLFDIMNEQYVIRKKK